MESYKFQVEVRDGEEPVMTKNNITSTITPVTCAKKFFQEWLDISNASKPVTIYLLDNDGKPIRAFDKVTTEVKESK